ncbi:MAG: CAP domain-containing protein [Myxococcota bacterium]
MPRDLHQAVGFLLGIALAFWLSPLRIQASGPGVPDPQLAPLEAELLRQVNDVRSQRHLRPLQRSEALDAVARAHSRDMAARGYIAHESPEGANAVDRLTQARLDGFTLAAENIGATSRAQPNREIVSGWVRSPIHARNLFSPVFNATGIGIARTSDGTLLYTQVYVTYPR